MGTITRIYDRIESINLTQRLALMQSQRVLPITHIFDREGNETRDITRAFTGVVGSDNEFVSFLMSDFGKKPGYQIPNWAREQGAL